MEEVLVDRTLMGLSAVKDLSDSLRATAETQRALADKVGPHRLPVLLHPVPEFVIIFCCAALSQVEAMKEVGLFFGDLIQELARLREAAVQGLGSLQAEHAKLEDEIRWAQERHQTVRADLRDMMQPRP